MKTFGIVREVYPELDPGCLQHSVQSFKVVCVGVIFPDNKVVLQWRGDIKSIVIHENIENVIKIHCNGDNNLIKYD